MAIEVKGIVTLDGAGWEAGLRRMESATRGFGNSFKQFALGAIGVAGLSAAVEKTIEYGEEIINLSRRLGIGVEALQEFGFAARKNGADLEALTGFIEKLNTARLDPKKVGEFLKLGITESDLHNLKVEEIIAKISARVQTSSSQEIIGPLRQVGGRAAGELLPMLKENLGELREEAHRLGQVMHGEDAVMLKFVADEMKVLAQTMVVALAPAINFLMVQILKFVNTIKSDSTFWGGFISTITMRTRSWSEVKKDFSSWADFTAFVKRRSSEIADAWRHAGTEAANEQDDLNEGLGKMIDGLMAKQKEIERINSIPDFDQVITKPKTTKEAANQLYSDRLLAVGNFLGATKDPIYAVAQHHTRLLNRIANATETMAKNNNNGNLLDMSDTEPAY